MGVRKPPESAHNAPDQLTIDDESAFVPEGCFHSTDPVSRPRGDVQLGHHVGEQQAAHVTVRGMTMLLSEVRRSVKADNPTRGTLGEAQVAQPFDDRAEDFGRTTPSPLNSALAAFTSSSSSSNSLMRRRAR